MSAPTADGLVAVLGWDLDDFESCCRRAERAVLDEALSVLETPTPGADSWINQRSEYGAKVIRRILAEDPPV